MGAVIVSVIRTLLGVLVGGAIQQRQAARGRAWQRADSLNDAKRRVYAEYLRAVSASYAQALSGQRTRSEDSAILAAKSEIEILADRQVAEPTRLLSDAVLNLHARIADDAGVAESQVGDIDRRRQALLDLFKADLGISSQP